MVGHDESAWRLLAVLESQALDGGSSQEKGLLHLAIVVIKVCMDVCTLAISGRGLWRSLMGVFCISLCLADAVLLAAMVSSWLVRGGVGTASLCFAMSHSSTVYSLLPIPFLLLGALDYTCSLGPGRNCGRPLTPCRVLAYSMLTLSVWALAGLYSYRYTLSEAVFVTEQKQVQLVCRVQYSRVVSYYSTGLCLAVACVPLFYCHRLLRAVLARPGQWRCVLFGPAPSRGQWEAQQECRPDVPLLLSLAMAFAWTWATFLVMSTVTTLLDMPFPAQLTVNLLWLLCANSLLIAATLWCRGGEAGPCYDLPDDACDWSDYCRRGDRGAEAGPQEKLLHGIYILSSSSATERLLPI